MSHDGEAPIPGLTPDDQRVLDALAENGFDPAACERLSDDERARADRLVVLLGLFDDYPLDGDDGDVDTLVHATLARIDRYEDDRTDRMRVGDESPGRSSRLIRIPDFFSVAAVLLVAAGVLFPTLSHLRRWSVDLECANHMRQAGLGMNSYVADYGVMPMATAGLGPSWDRAEHARNFDPLVDGGYCDEEHLHCPGLGHDHPGARGRYSYQWEMPRDLAAGVPRQATIIIGDRNPLIDGLRETGEHRHPLTISLAHGGRGQNVLRSDGATVTWLESPILGPGDNIWLPAGSTDLEPGADHKLEPGADHKVSLDVFLAQ
jgi:hypothetical protein